MRQKKSGGLFLGRGLPIPVEATNDVSVQTFYKIDDMKSIRNG